MRSKLSIFFISFFSLMFAHSNYAADNDATDETGKSLAFDKNKGNCLACHAIPSDPSAKSAGNIGPVSLSRTGSATGSRPHVINGVMVANQSGLQGAIVPQPHTLTITY